MSQSRAEARSHTELHPGDQKPGVSRLRLLVGGAKSPAAGEQLSVLVIDARPLIREALCRWLEVSARVCSAVSFRSATDTADAWGGGGEDKANRLVLLSVGHKRVTEDNVRQEIQALERHLPRVPIVVVSDNDTPDNIMVALRQGIRGYIPTSLSLPMVIDALRLVQAGGVFIPPDAIVASLQQIIPSITDDAEAGEAVDLLLEMIQGAAGELEATAAVELEKAAQSGARIDHLLTETAQRQARTDVWLSHLP